MSNPFMHRLVEDGDYEKVMFLLTSMYPPNATNTIYNSINERNSAGQTPLHIAAARGHVSLIHLLLDHNIGASSSTRADINAIDNNLGTPFELAVFNNCTDAALALLRYPTCNVLSASRYARCSPIHIAASMGNVAILQGMMDLTNPPLQPFQANGLPSPQNTLASLNHRVGVDHPDSERGTPLNYATQSHTITAVSLLLAYGASVSRDHNVLQVADRSCRLRDLESDSSDPDDDFGSMSNVDAKRVVRSPTLTVVLRINGLLPNHHGKALTTDHLARFMGDPYFDVFQALLDNGAEAF